MVEQANVDPAGVMAIQSERALSDPMIVHERWETAGAESLPGPVVADARQARLQQVMETDAVEPITKATWPEVAIYLHTTSLLYPLRAEWADHYKWAFRRWLVDCQQMDEDELPQPARGAEPPEDHQRRSLETLRKKLKVTRDRHYLEHRYDADHGVPKAFWTEWHSGGDFGFDEADYEYEGSPLMLDEE